MYFLLIWSPLIRTCTALFALQNTNCVYFTKRNAIFLIKRFWLWKVISKWVLFITHKIKIYTIKIKERNNHLAVFLLAIVNTRIPPSSLSTFNFRTEQSRCFIYCQMIFLKKYLIRFTQVYSMCFLRICIVFLVL